MGSQTVPPIIFQDSEIPANQHVGWQTVPPIIFQDSEIPANQNVGWQTVPPPGHCYTFKCCGAGGAKLVLCKDKLHKNFVLHNSWLVVFKNLKLVHEMFFC